MAKKRVVRRKGVGVTHTYHGVGKRQRPNIFIRLLQNVPSWGWWLGGIAIIAGYVWFFYYFFVSPFGFRGAPFMAMSAILKAMRFMVLISPTIKDLSTGRS